MNAITQLFGTITMFLVACQKFIASFNDCASMLNQATSTALEEQTAINADRLAKLKQSITNGEFIEEE